MLNTLIAFDVRLFSLINGAHAPFFDVFFGGATWLGNGWVTFPLFLLVVLLNASRRKVAGVLLAGAVAFASAGVLLQAVKKSVDRPRPVKYFSLQKSETPVHVVGPKLGARSFPSGHAQTAFTAAALLAFIYGGTFWMSFLFAFLVAYSRVYVGAHFPLDTVVGMVLGVAAAWGSVAGFRKMFWERNPEESVSS